MSGIHRIPFNPHRNPQGGKKRGERRMDEAAVKRQACEETETSGEEGRSEGALAGQR